VLIILNKYSRVLSSLILLLIAMQFTVCFLVLLQVAGVQGQPKSVSGGALDTCSKPGTALTGFTRDGHCQDQGDDDAGSHHICIEMPKKNNFCTATGQPNWCASKMECMEQEGQCAIGNWCVCQWAFARYIEEAGGCDAIVQIQCDATNMAAIRAYKSQSGDPSIKAALDCLESRCPVSL